jgi:integrase
MNEHHAEVHPTSPTAAAAASTTVGDYLTSWLAGRRALRPSTRLAYEIHLRKHLEPHLGDIPLALLSLDDIERMYLALAVTRGRDGQLLTAATIRRIHATLMSALTSAVRRGVLERNPAEHVEPPRAIAPRMRVWTADQLAPFLDVAGRDSSQPLFLLLALTGVRRGEAIGLRWIDLDLDQGLLFVEQQIVAVAGQQHTGPPKTSNGRRTLALASRLVDALDHHRAEKIEGARLMGVDWADTALVFTTALGTPLRPGQVSRHFQRLVVASGVPMIRLHDLRHSSASLGLASGESLLEVSRRLGHSSITITADVYSHVSSATARTSAQRLADSIGPNREPADSPRRSTPQ